MGLLIHGEWQNRWYDTKAHKGHFVRSAARFRNWITADGRPGPTGRGGFRAEPGRYHLYVALAGCRSCTGTWRSTAGPSSPTTA
jgi:putative glutathione S-transferase